MIESVKFSPIIPLIMGVLLSAPMMSSCKPQAPDLERLRAVETANEQLRKDISDMQKRIREAGEIRDDLKPLIDERRRAVNEALSQKSALRRQETALRLRYIELESRLKAFRDKFNDMKSSVANQN